jgi:uncharacterized damage-inducible protein DinB
MFARYLDSYRGVCLWKLEGVSEEDARRPMVPSGTSLLGVVKHLAYVERMWYQAVIAGRPVASPRTAEDPDADFRLEEGDTIASVRALFEEEWAKSREIHAELDDLDRVHTRGRRTMTVRDILAHLLEEVARHAGHLDIIREQLDGATGSFPPGGAPWD